MSALVLIAALEDPDSVVRVQAVGVIGYAFLSGLTLSPAAYLADLGMGVAAGGLFGMVLPKRA